MLKRICCFLFLVLLCCSCKAQYTVTIGDDLSISESLEATEDAEFFAEYPNSSVQRVVGFILESRLEELNSSQYSISYITDPEEGGAQLSNHFKNMEEYKLNSKLYSQYTDDWSYEMNGDIMTIRVDGILGQKEQDQGGKFKVDEAAIKIVLPFEVTMHNADEVDDRNHTYIWNLDSTTPSKEIMISFNTKSNVVKTDDNQMDYIIIGIVVVSVIIIGIVIFSIIQNGRKRNRLD